jgi:hypothetical protein
MGAAWKLPAVALGVELERHRLWAQRRAAALMVACAECITRKPADNTEEVLSDCAWLRA